MKIFCFDRDKCAFTHYLELKELEDYNLEQPFIKCLKCNELAVIVTDDFDLDDTSNLFQSFLKILEKEKNV
jgi:hypothetical protein